MQPTVRQSSQRHIDIDAQGSRILGFVRRSRSLRYSCRVDDAKEHRGVLIVDAGRRQKVEQQVQRLRLNANLLNAFASRCLLRGLARLHMASHDLGLLAEAYGQMRGEPELPDQHDHVARRVDREDANDLTDVQDIAGER